MKNFDDVLKDIKEKFEEEESKLKKFIKRAIILFISIFLIFLFLSYLGPGWRILDILEGQAASSNIEDLIVKFNNNTLSFKPEVYSALKQMWTDNQDKEFAVCLYGTKFNNLLEINDYKIPKVKSSSFIHVQAEFCEEDSLISMHKHPAKSCIFSDQDILYYNAYKEIKSDAIIGLICEEDRFSFYGL
ncbi:MAG: hypothetical protein Q8R00_00480 [Candidatus Nanoarchaeia archaeon]|nr:hypothetical protein [Candidatus Nanoarchaeia archaeon]